MLGIFLNFIFKKFSITYVNVFVHLLNENPNEKGQITYLINLTCLNTLFVVFGLSLLILANTTLSFLIFSFIKSITVIKKYDKNLQFPYCHSLFSDPNILKFFCL